MPCLWNENDQCPWGHQEGVVVENELELGGDTMVAGNEEREKVLVQNERSVLGEGLSDGWFGSEEQP